MKIKYIFIKCLFALLYIAIILQKANAQGLMREYCFQNNFDEVNSAAPALIQLCTGSFVSGTLCGGPRIYYHFDNNCGFYFNNSAAGNFVNRPNGHTVEIYMRFDNTSSWKRILDYKNRTVDQGVYAYHSAFQFYNYATGPTGVFNPGVWVYVAMVRESPSTDASETYKLYLAGSATPHAQFGDAGLQQGLPNAAGRISFFQDDFVVPNESSSGDVALVRIYNYPLTGAQITTNSLNPCPCGALPVMNWLAFSAQRTITNINYVEIDWLMNMPVLQGEFSVLRSVDGFNFEEAEKILVNQQTDPHFRWVDKNAPAQTCFYKIRYRNKDGVEFDTQTVQVEYNIPPQISIYPTLLQKNESSINLQVISIENHNISFQITDMLGNIIEKQSLITQPGQQTFKIPVHLLSSGMYFVQVQTNKETYTQKILIQ